MPPPQEKHPRIYEVTSEDLHHIVHTAVKAALLTTDSMRHIYEQPENCQYNFWEANIKTTTAIYQDTSEEDMQDFGFYPAILLSLKCITSTISYTFYVFD